MHTVFGEYLLYTDNQQVNPIDNLKTEAVVICILWKHVFWLVKLLSFDIVIFHCACIFSEYSTCIVAFICLYGALNKSPAAIVGVLITNAFNWILHSTNLLYFIFELSIVKGQSISCWPMRECSLFKSGAISDYTQRETFSTLLFTYRKHFP